MTGLPAHFHAAYGEHRACFDIQTLDCIEGLLPRRARALVVEWASLHKKELMANWTRARSGQPLDKISPLD